MARARACFFSACAIRKKYLGHTRQLIENCGELRTQFDTVSWLFAQKCVLGERANERVSERARVSRPNRNIFRKCQNDVNIAVVDAVKGYQPRVDHIFDTENEQNKTSTFLSKHDRRPRSSDNRLKFKAFFNFFSRQIMDWIRSYFMENGLPESSTRTRHHFYFIIFSVVQSNLWGTICVGK